MLENTIKGWITSLAGAIGVVLITLHAFGIYEFPNPKLLEKGWQVGIGYLVCGGLFFIKYGKIEAFFESAWSTVWETFVSLFKKSKGIEDKKEEVK